MDENSFSVSGAGRARIYRVYCAEAFTNQVETSQATVGPLNVTVDAEGKTRVRDRFVVAVLSSDAVKIKLGAPVVIEGWGGDKPLAARVRMIEPSGFTKVSALGVEEQRVNVVADFVEPQVPLGDGYRVEAKIVIWEKADALKVLTIVVFRSGEGWAAFVNENGVAKRRTVALGRRTAFEIEIIDGLREGEQAIVHPPNELKDGVHIVLNQQ